MLDTARLGMPRGDVDRGRGWPGHARGVERHGAALSRRHGGRLRGAGDRGGPPLWGISPGGARLAGPVWARGGNGSGRPFSPASLSAPPAGRRDRGLDLPMAWGAPAVGPAPAAV